MALTDTLPTADAGGLSIVDERLILSGLIVKNADGTARTGVFPSGTDPLVTGRASMGYDIAPFRAAVSRTGVGVELLANDATVINVPTDAAPGANSRIDVIYVRSQFTASTDPGNVPLFGVAKGTAAPVPTKPPIPAGALELAYAPITSSATTTASVVITQSAPWTAAAGGVVPFRNKALMDAWTTAVEGQRAVAQDTKAEYTRIGAVWVQRTALALGANKGDTVVPSGPWTTLNTAPGVGTNVRNDGYTYGAGGIAVPSPGIYRVEAQVLFPNSGAGSARGVAVGGSAGRFEDFHRASPFPNGAFPMSIAGTVQATTSIVIQALQDTGANQTVSLVSIAITRVSE